MVRYRSPLREVGVRPARGVLYERETGWSSASNCPAGALSARCALSTASRKRSSAWISGVPPLERSQNRFVVLSLAGLEELARFLQNSRSAVRRIVGGVSLMRSSWSGRAFWLYQHLLRTPTLPKSSSSPAYRISLICSRVNFTPRYAPSGRDRPRREPHRHVRHRPECPNVSGPAAPIACTGGLHEPSNRRLDLLYSGCSRWRPPPGPSAVTRSTVRRSRHTGFPRPPGNSTASGGRLRLMSCRTAITSSL